MVKGEVDSRVDGQGYWVIGRLLLEVQPLWFDEVGYIYSEKWRIAMTRSRIFAIGETFFINNL